MQCGCPNERDDRYLITPFGDDERVHVESGKEDWVPSPKIVEEQNKVRDIYSTIFHERPFGITFESLARGMVTKATEKKYFLHNVTNLEGVAAKAGIAPFSKIIQVNGNSCDNKMHSAVVEMLRTSELPCTVTFRSPSPFLSNYVMFDEAVKKSDICEV